ncbi:MAG: hypothetical protein WC956_05305 [bacterium]
MSLKTAAFDFSVLRTEDGRQLAGCLVKEDPLLTDDERRWLNWAIRTPDVFEMIPDLRDSFLSVVSRSEGSRSANHAAKFSPGVSRFLSDAPRFPSSDDQSQIGCGYDALRELAESAHAIMHLFRIDEDLLHNVLNAMRAMPSAIERIAAFLDVRHGYVIMGRGHRIGHDVMLNNLSVIFGQRMPAMIWSTFSALAEYGGTFLTMERVYASCGRTKIGEEWYGIVRNMARTLSPYVEFVSVEDGEMGQAQLAIDPRRGQESRPPIFQYRLIKFLLGEPREEEPTSQVEILTKADLNDAFFRRVSELRLSLDKGAGLFVRRVGEKWTDIASTLGEDAELEIARGTNIELRSTGPMSSSILTGVLDLVEAPEGSIPDDEAAGESSFEAGSQGIGAEACVVSSFPVKPIL